METTEAKLCRRVSDTGLEPTEEDLERLAAQPVLTEPWRRKLEAEAQRNWDIFYKRNTDKFFKDRHWSKAEILETVPELDASAEIKFLEAGSGVGNMLFPLAAIWPHWKFFAFDFSKNAIQLLNQRAETAGIPVQTAVVDLTADTTGLFDGTQVDFASLIFVLSAISPEKQVQAVQNLARLLAPGGIVLFRDYAAYDQTMMRFKGSNKIGDRFYKRADWTRAYFFLKEEINDIFVKAGFHEAKRLHYVHSVTENKQEGLCVPRVFVQGVFVKKF